MSERSELVNALIGAVVTVVLTFLPFSSVLGGGVAGYLQGGDLRDGLRVGAIAGVLAVVPLLLLLWLVGSVVAFGMLGMGAGGMGGAGGMLAVGAAFISIVVLFAGLYVVGLSAIGGAVGAAIRDETDT